MAEISEDFPPPPPGSVPIEHNGITYQVFDPQWVTGWVQAWLWNEDFGLWDEVQNACRLIELGDAYRKANPIEQGRIE